MNFSCFQSLRPRRTVADTVKNLVIAVSHQAFLSQSFNGGKFGHTARTRHADYLAFQIVYAADSFGADQSVIHIRLNAADDEYWSVLGDRPHRRYARYQRIIDTAADQCGHRSRSAGDKNGFYVQTFGGKKTEVLRDEKRQCSTQRRSVRSEVN